MANFNVYFKVTNNTGSRLVYISKQMGASTSLNFGGQGNIIKNNATGSFYLDGFGTWEGASGAVSWMTTAPVNGNEHNVYTWYGSCPVMSDNTWSGPGITNASGPGGHPLSVSIALTASTPPSSQWPSNAGPVDVRAIRAKIAGKKAL